MANLSAGAERCSPNLSVRVASSPNSLIKNVSFEDNKVTTVTWNPGGAAVSMTNSTATINQTIFKNNSCDCNGGGLYVGSNGTYTIKNSLFTGNTGKYGGALIANSEPVVTLKNTTLYGNHATAEGTFAVDDATVTYKNVTMVGNDNISGNSGFTAGAFMYATTSSTTFSNSIIYGNINTASGQEQNCKRRYNVGTSSRVGTFTSLGGNFMGDSVGDGAWGITYNNECLTFFGQATDRTATDPLVVAGAPSANGGPTNTIKLQSTSAAIDGGEDSQCESLDQRGETRPAGNHCDSGALEMQSTD